MDAGVGGDDLVSRARTLDPGRATAGGIGPIARASGADGSSTYTDRLARSAEQVRRFVARRVANPADAADIAQQTLLVALAKEDDFRGGRFSSWLFTIARHLIVDHYRAERRHEFVQLECPSSSRVEPALQTARDGVARACESRDRLRCWLSCVTRHLTLEEQVAVLLADVYGYQDKDSAALLDKSLPSFKLLLHGSRVRLQRRAGGLCSLARATALVGPVVAVAAPRAAGAANLPPRAIGLTRHPAVARRLLALRARLLAGLPVAIIGLWLVAVFAAGAWDRHLSFRRAGSSSMNTVHRTLTGSRGSTT